MIGWVLAIGIWSLCGLLWWVIALVIVVSRRRSSCECHTSDPRGISVFKPVAGPVGAAELTHLRRCLESFVAELDEHSEILVGVTETDKGQVAALADDMRQQYPLSRIRLIVHASSEEYPNHKIAVMKALSRHATYDLWFWSDADMEAPPGTLQSLREDFTTEGAAFVTSPYIVRHAGAATDVFDQLFVNLEFYPGTVLMGRMGRIGFGFGSGLLFEAARFRRCVDWDYLGSCLADDYQLGRLLGRGCLGKVRLATVPGPSGWGSALLHYLRWHKTIRWCRPVAYAAELCVLPIVGCLLSVLCYPISPLPWYALGGVVTLDSMAAYLLCRALGSPLPLRYLPAVAGWSILRGFVWMACWLPWPIVWRGEKWWSPHLEWRSGEAAFDTHPPGTA